jgi:hypothetical protein
MSLRRVVFLDIDGVLNTHQFRVRVNHWQVMDPVNVINLRRVIERTRAVLVISSTWRFLGNNWEETIRRVFSEAGWNNPPIIGRTPVLERRGREIATWLDEHEVLDFIIVDDDIFDMLPDQEPHIINCDEEVGFTEENANEIERRWL